MAIFHPWHEMESSTLLSCGNTASLLKALFRSSKQNPHLGFASIQLHDAVFRLKLLEEDLSSHRDGLVCLEKDEVSLVDTLDLHFSRIKRVLDQIEECMRTSEESLLRTELGTLDDVIGDLIDCCDAFMTYLESLEESGASADMLDYLERGWLYTNPSSDSEAAGSQHATFATLQENSGLVEMLNNLWSMGKDEQVSSQSTRLDSEPLKAKKPAIISRIGDVLNRKDDSGDASKTPYRRFWVNEDDTHGHHHKSEGHDEEQPPSLTANWIDVVHNKNEKLAEQKNLGHNVPKMLMQKYSGYKEVDSRGAFNIVRVAHKTDVKGPTREQLYAVKEFKKRQGESVAKYQKRSTADFCISSSMLHPNVVSTLDLLQDDNGIYYEVVEYCTGGDLYALVCSVGQLEVVEANCFFKQLMRGVKYMHEMGITHRDLKPENLLLTPQGLIKISNFSNSECFRMAWETEAHMTTGLYGSTPYIAPEQYVDLEFDPRAVDMWACGITYITMRTGRHLWRVAQKGEDESFDRYLGDRVTEAGYRPIEVLRGRQCRNVICSILDPNPTSRLTAHQVLTSEWVQKIKVCHDGNESS